jgi:hypothetical protein
MNSIKKHPVQQIGYGYISGSQIPMGNNEYHLRNVQNRMGIPYRALTQEEAEALQRNGNSSDNWNNVLVSELFNPNLIKGCTFYGLVRIGNLENFFLEFNGIRTAVGLYNSTIISCDFGNNVVVDNVNYLSHYIIGNECILLNINELACTSNTKFGNGIVKDGEKESVRIWLEVCNENAGRKILPFVEMLPADAYLFSQYKHRSKLQQQLIKFTDDLYDRKRGYYGKIGDRTVIKNCKIIKNAWIGTDAYLKGVNKLKNVTLNSSSDEKSQVGEGCEIVNGIIGFGCRIFYGVKAVRFVMANHSQLKYGARLLNSYLGYNSTISCCEVLNSLLFPFHEQHHNNSFLIASTLKGQSNMAAGATIGSNHNSRSADGEIVAERGFWPGLCVSLKHNSKFASHTIIAKGNYSYELSIPLPFSLISQNEAKNELIIMPAYWFMYNMYALARNQWKYKNRDKRKENYPLIEYNYLAPDTINEIIIALELLEYFTGKSYCRAHNIQDNNFAEIGKYLLNQQPHELEKLNITAEGFENNQRQVILLKVNKAYIIFKDLINYHCINNLLDIDWQTIESNWQQAELTQWINAGGQLIQKQNWDNFIEQIENNHLSNWHQVQSFYKQEANAYKEQKRLHAIAAYKKIINKSLNKQQLINSSQQAVATGEWIVKNIEDSRLKDFTSPYRKMMYENEEEMYAVLGNPRQNEFIKNEIENLAAYKVQVTETINKWQAQNINQ